MFGVWYLSLAARGSILRTQCELSPALPARMPILVLLELSEFLFSVVPLPWGHRVAPLKFVWYILRDVVAADFI